MNESERSSNDPAQPEALNLTTRIVIGKTVAPAAGQAGAAPAAEDLKHATGRLVGVGHMEPKSSTTRISLDAAPEAVVQPKPGTPRTIVLKKPSASDEAGTPAMPAVDLQKSKTAQIQLPPEADLGGSATRRKTIKIKRPTGPAGGVTVAARSVVIARPEQLAADGPVAVMTEDQPGALYVILTLAAVLVAVAVVGVEVMMP